MFKKVVVGGTFNKIHKGHDDLLKTTFNVGEYVYIGLTSDKFANLFRAEKVLVYKKRKDNLKKKISALNLHSNYEILKIDDMYGIATLEECLNAIVVSEETLPRAQEINAIRFKKRLKRMTIVVVPFVLKNNYPVSSGLM
ncbi:MAG: pantetheine-phosphate adenylyltransferase [Candidatus Altiarchaeum hamiconexum]|uniref:Pantetheine-phosphate adenylyltransferase n=1 Tax=Candidatus Altarchaeum hamiconexum TaxID=1803513 RepID=A0A8J7YTW2_9ARCH|nr:pantetheine-phosphate adenylyltransferase [Candidatus Altarchaeum hamiconexum]OIQ06211.1 MAG: hypothetical protein AUK59_00735 [Candidatus Altarchaeum sp. CG2_30_32_3053]PIN67354.1 MAG: phosphopantetheine adenylyltransferase [Candidatus Altarchaeum sp. CG12_big_fil_rev_8_21_14_0_65_33_22]PIV27292.1 MAG: phosphopantetheine adenylyltransferase [Candidatus Altarchaeum sp. CG03_land_8_20_14_0_80_32_618]PIX49336.1 MAG: phosphopantetheine adenylyltransferase [Candidatus Altarchaeum sp. CG_4_8_14_3